MAGPPGPTGPIGPTGPTGINADTTPLSASVGEFDGSSLSPVFQATYTGGAPGSVTYNWQDLAVDFGSLSAVWFVNPVNSSSQRIQITNVLPGAVKTATARCRITDSQGNVSFGPTISYIHENLNAGPPG